MRSHKKNRTNKKSHKKGPHKNSSVVSGAKDKGIFKNLQSNYGQINSENQTQESGSTATTENPFRFSAGKSEASGYASVSNETSKRVTFDLHQERHRKRDRQEDSKRVNSFLVSYPPNVLESFDRKELQDLKNMFSKYKDSNGKITNTMTDLLIRSYGYNPSEYYMLKCLHKVDSSGIGQLNEIQFLTIIADMKCTFLSNAELIEIFKTFDPDNIGYISVEEMVSILTTLGETLDQSEMDEFVGQADVAGLGKIYYEELVERMNILMEYNHNIDLRRIVANRYKKKFMTKAKKEKKLAKKLSSLTSGTSNSTSSQESSFSNLNC
ncbi:uncharacterized protein isoform X2 [Rhodnius prolixus]|uniref:uncharacterized protein isoform X2 n=1 Tax=Rhodnius prolixus TaxID=13249 RepID=UPI003D18ADDA